MTLSGQYFDDLYQSKADPWGFASRAYERRKYALTLAALPREHYRRAFEPGCSIGVLTAQLAARARELVAADVSAHACEITAARRLENVEVLQLALPREWPSGMFDLVVFSELGYYFDEDDLSTFVSNACACLEPGGHLVAVHWRPKVADYPLDAARVHRRLGDSELEPLAHYEDVHVLLDVLGKGLESAIAGPEEADRA